MFYFWIRGLVYASQSTLSSGVGVKWLERPEERMVKGIEIWAVDGKCCRGTGCYGDSMELNISTCTCIL